MEVIVIEGMIAFMGVDDITKGERDEERTERTKGRIGYSMHINFFLLKTTF